MGDFSSRLGDEALLRAQEILLEVLQGWALYVREVTSRPELKEIAEKKLFEDAEAAYQKLGELTKMRSEFYKFAREVIEGDFEKSGEYTNKIDLAESVGICGEKKIELNNIGAGDPVASIKNNKGREAALRGKIPSDSSGNHQGM